MLAGNRTGSVLCERGSFARYVSHHDACTRVAIEVLAAQQQERRRVPLTTLIHEAYVTQYDHRDPAGHYGSTKFARYIAAQTASLRVLCPLPALPVPINDRRRIPATRAREPVYH